MMHPDPEVSPSLGAPTRSLHRKLAEVMAEVERIPKRGKAPTAMGGFEFVQVGDAADAIRKALGERHVSMLPTQVEIVSEAEHQTRSGGTMTTQSIRTTWTLTDGDTGEQAVIQSLGTGADSGDKFSPKAQTNAMKYALLMGFLLSTGDDPELSDSSDRGARRAAPPSDPNAPAVQHWGGPRPVQVPPAFSPVAATHEGGLIGIAEKTKDAAEFAEQRVGPAGPVVAFRLVEGRRAVKVIAFGVMAELVVANREKIEHQRVTLWGTVEDEDPWTPPGTTRVVVVQHVRLERLKVGDLDLSEPDVDAEDEAALDALAY